LEQPCRCLAFFACPLGSGRVRREIRVCSRISRTLAYICNWRSFSSRQVLSSYFSLFSFPVMTTLSRLSHLTSRWSRPRAVVITCLLVARIRSLLQCAFSLASPHLGLVRSMKRLFATALLWAAVSLQATGKDKNVWLTGTVFLGTKNQLMFRADDPIAGNATGRFVFFDVAPQSKHIVFPICLEASKDHVKRRFYGQLTPVRGHKDRNTPSFRFTVWRAHSPSEPDDSSLHDEILFGASSTPEASPSEPK